MRLTSTKSACVIALAMLSTGCLPIGPDTAAMTPQERAAALAEARAIRACIGAVQRQTETTGASHNTDLVVVEINQYIIDVPSTGPTPNAPWTCITDDTGTPQYLYQTRVIAS